MILICTNEVAGPTGYHKSVIQLSNGLHEAGYHVALMSFLGSGDSSERMMPLWPPDPAVPVYNLRSLPAEGGSLLHENVFAEWEGNIGGLKFAFTTNQLAALRQINEVLTKDDTIIFTAPIQAMAFQRALAGSPRNPKTVLQIHGDYRHHRELWEPLMDIKSTIDRIQTVADGLREQFIPVFGAEQVRWIPNFPGEVSDSVKRVAHEGVNIALPASFQPRKNQLDAVRALALIKDPAVHLTLWGNANASNPYVLAVKELVADLGLEERVNFAGFGAEHDVYSTADVVLMTSLSEGFPYPLLEAMYHSCPTVSYNFNYGPREAIDEGVTGFVVPLGDVEALADRLTQLSADASLRAEFGANARSRFDAIFSPSAVADQYRNFLGPVGRAIDFAEVFATDEHEPIATSDITHCARRRGGRVQHRIEIAAHVQLADVSVRTSHSELPIILSSASGKSIIEFSGSGPAVVSYVPSGSAEGRRVLGLINETNQWEMPAHLRRDASYLLSEKLAKTGLYASAGGGRHFNLLKDSATIASQAPRDVLWKLKQVARLAKQPSRTQSQTAQGATKPTAQPLAQSDAVAAPLVSSQATESAQHSLHSRFMDFQRKGAKVALRLLNKVVTTPAAPTQRTVARHPWFPVTSGIDNFGVPINTPGGVEVANTGGALAPAVTISGEYDWLVLRDGSGMRRVSPPFSYGEFFEKVCAAEREYGLFDLTTRNGVHVWELGRSALIIQLAESLGFWGAAPAVGIPPLDEYSGSKCFGSAPRSRRVVFDYARRGQSGYRTSRFVDEDTLFVVQPDAEGYPGVTETNMVYPFHEFLQFKADARHRLAQLRVPDVDARPYEEALSKTLGIHVDLGGHLRSRLAKFMAEREFWTPVFERVQPEEVLIASSHWWAGIAAAAARSGAQVSDIQYALTSRYAPSFWFGQKPYYGASRFYAWSDFWAARTNAYQEHVVVPRDQPEFSAAVTDAPPEEKIWDVCVISQPRVLRRILAFVNDMVRERPELRVVIAPHPAQVAIIDAELVAAGLDGRIEISSQGTLSTIQKSAMAVGTFSTSLWEAAALGCPTYVLEVPGFEETLEDVESGLFRVARTPGDLKPFMVPTIRHHIFK